MKLSLSLLRLASLWYSIHGHESSSLRGEGIDEAAISTQDEAVATNTIKVDYSITTSHSWGTCGYGYVGDGYCADGSCCSVVS